MVIMILWRPSNNNQVYAFTPLLDSGDEDEDEIVANDHLGWFSVYSTWSIDYFTIIVLFIVRQRV